MSANYIEVIDLGGGGSSGNGGASDFDGLSDTPSSKVGFAGRLVTISEDETSLVYTGLEEYKNNGRWFAEFTLTNEITVVNGAAFNLFNSTNGMLSSNGNLVFSGDDWDQPLIIDSEYISPDKYLGTETPYQDIETAIFLNIPVSISGNQIRDVEFEVRRRTALSPTVPVAIPGRKVTSFLSSNSDILTVQQIPTRSSTIDDNYYVYGYAVFLINTSGVSITIPAGGTIRLESFNQYRRPIAINVTEVDPFPLPTTNIQNIVVIGDSQATVFGNDLSTPNASITQLFNDAGQAVNVYGRAVPGTTLLGMIPFIEQAVAAFPNNDTLFFLLGGTNDVNNIRLAGGGTPITYSSASPAQLAAVRSNYEQCVAAMGQQKNNFIVDSIPFCDFLQDTRDNEENGTKPYYDNITVDFLNTYYLNTDGRPVIDRYGYWAEKQYSTDPDGVHLTPDGDRAFVNDFISRTDHIVNQTGILPTPRNLNTSLIGISEPEQIIVNFGLSSLNWNGNAGSDGLTGDKVRNKDVIPLFGNNHEPSVHSLTFEHIATATNQINTGFNAGFLIGTDFDFTLNSDPFFRENVYIRNTTPCTFVVSGYTVGQVVDFDFMGYSAAPSSTFCDVTEVGNPSNTVQYDASTLGNTFASLTLTANASGEIRFTVSAVNKTFAYLGGFIATPQ